MDFLPKRTYSATPLPAADLYIVPGTPPMTHRRAAPFGPTESNTVRIAWGLNVRACLVSLWNLKRGSKPWGHFWLPNKG